jgi:hypothetical protein
MNFPKPSDFPKMPDLVDAAYSFVNQAPALPVNPHYPHMKLGGFHEGDRVRIGQSPYVFYVHSIEPWGVRLHVPGMTGRHFAVAFECVERVEE